MDLKHEMVSYYSKDKVTVMIRHPLEAGEDLVTYRVMTSCSCTVPDKQTFNLPPQSYSLVTFNLVLTDEERKKKGFNDVFITVLAQSPKIDRAENNFIITWDI